MDFIQYFIEVDQFLRESKVNDKDVTIDDYLTAMASKFPFYIKDTKNIILAECLRQKGNVAFVDKRYQEAANLYTESMIQAIPYSTCAAISYANRSAASFHMELYKECILDIDRALDLPYPNELRPKLIQRRENATTSMTQIGIEVDSDVEDTVPLSFTPNISMKQLNIGVELRLNAQNKRELVAKIPFGMGSVVAIHQPFLVVPLLQDNLEYCHHCIKKSHCLIPCERCTQVCYCSEKCKTEAYNSYHRIECEIKRTISTGKFVKFHSVDYALRFLNIFSNQGESLADFLQVFHEMTTYSESIDKQIYSSSLRTFLSLSSRIDTKERTIIRFQSAYLAILLCNYTNFFKQKSDVKVVAEILERITSIYLSHNDIIVQPGTNANAGLTVYPLLNLTPHACLTNTVAYIRSDNAMVLCASHFIKPGEEISYNYRNIVNHCIMHLKIMKYERTCLRCDTLYTYPMERQVQIRINNKLRKSLKNNPYDIRSLWQLLNYIHSKYQHYHWRGQLVKLMIVDSYERQINKTRGLDILDSVGLD